MSLIEIEDLQVWYGKRRGGFRKRAPVRAVDGASLTIGEEEVVGLVGESGSGKSTIGRAILQLVAPTGGVVRYRGQDTAHLSGPQRRELKRSVQAVFQDPSSSFNPRMRVVDIVSEPLRLQGMGKAAAAERAAEVLADVGLDDDVLARYPHQFSGGQRQRIAIARALSVSPKLIVMDEPVASLDVSIRGQVINLLADLRTKFGLSILLISHDLPTTRHLSDRVYVLYSGQVVEDGPTGQLYDEPMHPYTTALLSAADHDLGAHRPAIVGEPPDPRHPPSGCRFHPRCPWAMEVCAVEPPQVHREREASVSCHLYPSVDGLVVAHPQEGATG